MPLGGAHFTGEGVMLTNNGYKLVITEYLVSTSARELSELEPSKEIKVFRNFKVKLTRLRRAPKTVFQVKSRTKIQIFSILFSNFWITKRKSHTKRSSEETQNDGSE